MAMALALVTKKQSNQSGSTPMSACAAIAVDSSAGTAVAHVAWLPQDTHLQGRIKPLRDSKSHSPLFRQSMTMHALWNAAAH